jgi:hypothetical protein
MVLMYANVKKILLNLQCIFACETSDGHMYIATYMIHHTCNFAEVYRNKQGFRYITYVGLGSSGGHMFDNFEENVKDHRTGSLYVADKWSGSCWKRGSCCLVTEQSSTFQERGCWLEKKNQQSADKTNYLDYLGP